ncbi:MAG: lamin tail domain-containing protein, partial [Paramuribaculum sp.]|nr:lamin tail domain-containing protein [Paramuribaculum sp.]
MKTKFLTLLLIVVAAAATANGQGRRGLRINEVMVENTSSVVDDYGCRPAWIELYNSTYAPLEISSVFLTTDSTNKKMYPVPLGDVNTRLPKRPHIVFWAATAPTKG